MIDHTDIGLLLWAYATFKIGQWHERTRPDFLRFLGATAAWFAGVLVLSIIIAVAIRIIAAHG